MEQNDTNSQKSNEPASDRGFTQIPVKKYPIHVPLKRLRHFLAHPDQVIAAQLPFFWFEQLMQELLIRQNSLIRSAMEQYFNNGTGYRKSELNKYKYKQLDKKLNQSFMQDNDSHQDTNQVLQAREKQVKGNGKVQPKHFPASKPYLMHNPTLKDELNEATLELEAAIIAMGGLKLQMLQLLQPISVLVWENRLGHEPGKEQPFSVAECQQIDLNQPSQPLYLPFVLQLVAQYMEYGRSGLQSAIETNLALLSVPRERYNEAALQEDLNQLAILAEQVPQKMLQSWQDLVFDHGIY